MDEKWSPPLTIKQRRPMNIVTNIILITGPSGAGRSTAINVFEDMGFETIHNMPLSLVHRFLSNSPPADGRDIVLGVDIRTRDFNVKSVIELIEMINEYEGYSCSLLYIDCSSDILLRRYSETRRRHPFSPDNTPLTGIENEKNLLETLYTRADVIINTTEFNPHDLRNEITAIFSEKKRNLLAVNIQSFSYKRGVPHGIDMVLDCRFLRNPYWDKTLRIKTGMDQEVRSYIKKDARYNAFFTQVVKLIELLLPAYREEGKSHFTIGLGCTGGQHRSVTLTEELAESLVKSGWQVSIRHREIERHAVKI